MSYIVTARKWRPARFEEVVGQEHITVTLKNAIKNNRIAHAYLFAGPRGVGKTTTARILAKTLNCLRPVDFEPCNECDMCQSFNSSQSLDIIEIDGASNRRIEEIRTLRDSVKYAPTKGEYKVYIIDEVHMLTNESFNALLKTLEEPPEHTIFIFATTDVHKVPLTIISRCQRFDFRRIELSVTKSLLKKIADAENIKIDDQSLTIIAKRADGALRDAESLFDQLVSFCGHDIEAGVVSQMLNLIDDDVLFGISDAILSKSYISAFEISKKVYDNGWNFIDFMNELVEHFRNIMLVVLSGNAGLIETSELNKKNYLKYKDKFSEGDLLRILHFLNTTQQELRFSQNHRIKIEVALYHLIGLEKSSTLKEVISNLEDIKKKTPINRVSERAAYPQAPKPARHPEETIPISAGFNLSANLSGIPTDLLNLSDIQKKWQYFINEVNQEKFIVGAALGNLKLLSFDGQKLNVELNDPAAKTIINSNKEYFSSKTQMVFGKNIIFNFEEIQENVISEIFNDEEESGKDDPNPLIRSIFKDLGGEEILS